MRRLALGAAMGVAALAVAPAASLGTADVSAAKSKTKTVKVGDYFLSPTKLKVKRGTKIRWKWLASNGDSHDVKLKKGPKHVKHFHSEIASTDFTYSKRLKKKGKYTIICTLHPTQMRQTITVK